MLPPREAIFTTLEHFCDGTLGDHISIAPIAIIARPGGDAVRLTNPPCGVILAPSASGQLARRG